MSAERTKVLSNALKGWLLVGLLTSILVPIGVFLGGWFLAGPYEGDGGVFGLMGVIYRDALTGKPAALLLLSAPLILVGIWLISFKLHRSITAHTPAAAD